MTTPRVKAVRRRANMTCSSCRMGVKRHRRDYACLTCWEKLSQGLKDGLQKGRHSLRLTGVEKHQKVGGSRND